MATFLDLAQKVAAESGTISGVQPSAVTGQTGRLALVVRHVRDAWVEIQASRDDWRFLRKTFSGGLTQGTLCYTPASFSLIDHARWITDQHNLYADQALSLYKTSAGQADEGALDEISYELWRRRYDRGVHDANRPTQYAIDPQNGICFGPTPDDGYTVRGEYMRTPQELETDGDVPIMPARFHDLIAWRALMKLGAYDEAEWPVQRARSEYEGLLDDLMRDQLPRTGIDWEPLA